MHLTRTFYKFLLVVVCLHLLPCDLFVNVLEAKGKPPPPRTAQKSVKPQAKSSKYSTKAKTSRVKARSALKSSRFKSRTKPLSSSRLSRSAQLSRKSNLTRSSQSSLNRVRSRLFKSSQARSTNTKSRPASSNFSSNRNSRQLVSSRIQNKTSERSRVRSGSLSSNQANAPHIKRGESPPYKPDTRARSIKLDRSRVFVRFHGANNTRGQWVARYKDVKGLSAKQVQNKLGLKNTPTHMSFVVVPKNTRLTVGTVGAQKQWGVSGGGTQYYINGRIPERNFRFTREIR